MISDRGPDWAEPTLDELLLAYLDSGDEGVYARLAGAEDEFCPDCWKRLMVELIRQHAAQAVNVEFAELGS